MSADMSPYSWFLVIILQTAPLSGANIGVYCLAHDEWLIMKVCMHVGYHDANDVSNFCGDPVTQLNLKNVLKKYLEIYSDDLPYCCSLCVIA